jgi:hypothetical protein
MRQDRRVEVLVQAMRVDGLWEVLGDGDRFGHREAWWRENATPGAYEDFRTIERVTTTYVEDEVITP